jgi:ATP-dependent Lon protease
MDEIGLFPLGMVLLPGERVPLHVFEPRYKELVGECLDGESVFGLILADDRGAIREIGTTAAVVEVLERFDDGRLNILVEGRDRFHVVAETAGRSYRTAHVSPLEDAGEEPTADEAERCFEAYRRVAAEAETEIEEPDTDDVPLSYWLAARVDFGPDVKQEILELPSERERIVRLEQLLDRARDALAWARTARTRAQGNGRVEPPG